MTNKTLIGYWIKRFLLEYVVTERNLSNNTQLSYRDMFVLLLPYASKELKKSVDHIEVTDLSPRLLRAFLSHLEQNRHCSATTRNQRLAAIHALARFIGEHHPEYIDWCTQVCFIPFKKTMHASITYLEKPEMDGLLAAPNRNTLQGQRDYAMLLFLYNSGARASEAAKLTIADLDWHTQCVHINGKGNKQRICPLWKETMELLRQMTGQRSLAEHVFINKNGLPLTRFGIHTLVKRNGEKAAVTQPSLSTKQISPHVIRHTTATHLLRAGVDINTIRAWLGHVSINTTNIYAEGDLETKARALLQCAPDEKGRTKGHWSSKPDLMNFLREL